MGLEEAEPRLRCDLITTGMLLAAGGLISVARVPTAGAAGTVAGLLINNVTGTVWLTTGGGPTQSFKGSVRITHLELIIEAERTFAAKGFLSGNVFDGETFVRNVPETPFGVPKQPNQQIATTVLSPSPKRAEVEPYGAPGVIPAAFEVPEEQPADIQLAQTGACPILNLDIGAINLNLLGLVVDLAPVILNITAGAGNLLGHLLCAVANLLNGTGTGGLSQHPRSRHAAKGNCPRTAGPKSHASSPQPPYRSNSPIRPWAKSIVPHLVRRVGVPHDRVGGGLHAWGSAPKEVRWATSTGS